MRHAVDSSSPEPARCQALPSAAQHLVVTVRRKEGAVAVLLCRLEGDHTTGAVGAPVVGPHFQLIACHLAGEAPAVPALVESCPAHNTNCDLAADSSGPDAYKLKIGDARKRDRRASSRAGVSVERRLRADGRGEQDNRPHGAQQRSVLHRHTPDRTGSTVGWKAGAYVCEAARRRRRLLLAGEARQSPEIGRLRDPSVHVWLGRLAVETGSLAKSRRAAAPFRGGSSARRRPAPSRHARLRTLRCVACRAPETTTRLPPSGR